MHSVSLKLENFRFHSSSFLSFIYSRENVRGQLENVDSAKDDWAKGIGSQRQFGSEPRCFPSDDIRYVLQTNL
jgi:hypothetical protein